MPGPDTTAARTWRALVAAPIGIVLLLLLQVGSLAHPPLTSDRNAPVPVAATLQAARLHEPLVATAPTTAEEDLALAHAVTAWGQRSRPDDVSSLTAFLSSYPDSGWAPALLTNLGLSYLHYGYFSRAIDAWRRAWALGKAATEPRARALVDRAVGELARLYASLGHVESLAALFEEIGDRKVSGSATEAVQVASEQLLLVRKDPRHLFICGPVALRLLILAQDAARRPEVNFLSWYRAGPDGTSLAEVAGLADKARFPHRLVFRGPGQKVPIPSVVHWKVGHFATIIGEANGRFHVEDPVFPGRSLWVTQAALDAEASGYFLVPADMPADAGWRPVEQAEAGRVWGKGPTTGTTPGDAGDPTANGRSGHPRGTGRPTVLRGAGGPPGNGQPGDQEAGNDPGDSDDDDCPLCSYDIKESSVSLTLYDVPVGYTPPVGPSVKVRITYNQREANQPQNFSFFNVSPKWTLNWLSYVTDDPNNPGANVSRFLPGGGAYFYSGYASGTGRFANQFDDGSVLVLASQAPITYQRRKQDGSIEIYARSDGSTGFPRNVFLSQVIDPQGNAVTLDYDGQQRLVSLTDAVGRQTTFTYGLAARPLLVTQITDPFGRSAILAYDGNGRLSSITDILGLTSSFTYDANSLVNTLTTPYGTTTFAYTAPGTSSPPRFVQVTDPMGFSEREEWVEPAPVPESDPPATVPQGMPVALTNGFLQYRNSFHWDKHAYVVAGCAYGQCDYSKARIRHFSHLGDAAIKSTALESVKYPLENRIWFAYPGQTNAFRSGTYNQPAAIGRVLDDGTTQLTQYTYDTGGFFNITSMTDPVGRKTSFIYANGIDLSAISQTTAYGVQTTIAQFTYSAQHRPLIYTDAAGQTTTYTYNAAGQLTSVTNPLNNQTTTYQYDSLGRLGTITNANNVVIATYTYDAYDRVATFVDSEGWSVSYSYDAADRLTKTTYPDGTTETYSYNRLDRASYKDRLGRLWSYTHDANRRLTRVTDPQGNQTQYGYDEAGRQTSLTDPKGNITRWSYDVQGRLTAKRYADGSTVTYTYENAGSRLKSVTDALGQTMQYGYTKDDRLGGIVYLNAANPTPNVGFSYDPYFPRLASMTDGNGTTHYGYVPVGMPGALRLQQETGPLPNSAIIYMYDAIGRISSRTVSGSTTETFQYDAINRLVGFVNDLGTFTMAYLGQTGQITQRQLANTTLSTTWNYLPNAGDRRLAEISNVGLSSGQFLNYQFTTTPEDLITAITETSDSPIAYPGTARQTAGYNDLNQLTHLSGQPVMTYDANGNLVSDGQRNYSWDAENRLVSVTYSAQPGKQTTFTYDGLGRRTAISSTPAGGGSTVTTSYIWCDARLCQARNASNAVTRAYYDEGEFVPGTLAQTYYYGFDQLGSVRRVFATPSTAPGYAYDPFGMSLQGPAPLTDFGFAGMFYQADSGMYLTHYRVYDPAVGRWLSRDPIGESSDPTANLYAYVQDNPVNLADPSGLQIPTAPPPGVPGGPWTSAGAGQQPGTFYGPKQPSGPKAICRWVPAYGQGGPPGSQGYWKVKVPGVPGWNRYNQSGSPITQQQAHPNPPPANPPPVPAESLPAIVRYGDPLGVFLSVFFHSSPAY